MKVYTKSVAIRYPVGTIGYQVKVSVFISTHHFLKSSRVVDFR